MRNRTLLATAMAVLALAACDDSMLEVEDDELASDVAGGESCEDDGEVCLACATVDDYADYDEAIDELEDEGDGEVDAPGDLGDPAMVLGGGRGKSLFEILKRLAKCAPKAAKLAGLSKEALKELFKKTLRLIPGFDKYLKEAMAILKRCPHNFGDQFEQIADLARYIDDLKRVTKGANVPELVKEMAELIIAFLENKLGKLAKCLRNQIGPHPHPSLRVWLQKLDDLGL